MAQRSKASDSVNNAAALLPAGLGDVLPPLAEQEAAAIETLVASFRSYGYERVKPPLIEFETGLLTGTGAAMASQTFRLMDPVSQRMMGVRADITVQVARIAATRLAKMPRPLRLSYAGQVLRVKGTQLRPERQFAQVGAELIGIDAATADAEIIILAAEALQRLNIAGLSVDIALPGLVPLLLNKEISDDLHQALDRRDIDAVTKLGGTAGKTLVALIGACGPVASALAALDKISLPAHAQDIAQRLKDVIRQVSAALPKLTLTIDFVERQGFSYEQGIAFTLFARGVRGELGRGGDYLISIAEKSGTKGSAGEPACGVTLYMDSVLRALPAQEPAQRLYLPHGTNIARATALRQEGWVTVMGLAKTKDNVSEARRLGCTHILAADKPKPV